MRSRRLLYVGGAYFPAAGGSERTMHVLLSVLASGGDQVQVVTGHFAGRPESEVIDGVSVQRCYTDELDTVLPSVVEEFEPDAVVTQLIWSPQAMRFCLQRKLPLLYMVRSIGGNIDLSHDAYPGPIEILADSPVSANFAMTAWGRTATIIPPSFNADRVVADSTGDLVTMVNPVAVKGGQIFRSIVENMPDRQFLAVRGWDHLRDTNGNGWSAARMREMAEAFADEPSEPDEVILDGLPNVEVSGPYEDMREVFGRTRVLLVPSIWEENFGGVAIEAHLNGIPVIASARGNLRRTVDRGGLIIEDVENISNWIDAIEQLDDPRTYGHLSELARQSAKRFDSLRDADAVRRLIDGFG